MLCEAPMAAPDECRAWPTRVHVKGHLGLRNPAAMVLIPRARRKLYTPRALASSNCALACPRQASSWAFKFSTWAFSSS